MSDYEMLLAEKMVQGADVWVNTPRRPWEACGTSGMKVLVNGGINLSELDGWWAEAYTPDVGWALGDEKEHGDDPAWDEAEATALYDLLENKIVPEFYNCNPNGIPLRWVQRMRQSMSTLTPQFSANRAVRQYTEQHYLPAATAYLQRASNTGAAGVRIAGLKNQLSNNWQAITFGQRKVQTYGNGFAIHITISLKGINPLDVLVELYAEGMLGAAPEHMPMALASVKAEVAGYIYKAEVSTARPDAHYTVRIMPAYEGISVPLEDNLILGER